MSTPTGPEGAVQPVNPPLGKDATADEIESDIERTRAELGDTVDALTQKLDVKSQAQHKAADVKKDATERVRAARVSGEQALAQVKQNVVDTATDDAGKVKPVVPAGAAAVVAVLVAVAVLVGRRRR